MESMLKSIWVLLGIANIWISISLWTAHTGKSLFLDELTHNMTKNCSLIYQFSRGKYFSEALILASTNPQYDKRLFIVLQV